MVSESYLCDCKNELLLLSSYLIVTKTAKPNPTKLEFL